jgi:hypothetical protein
MRNMNGTYKYSEFLQNLKKKFDVLLIGAAINHWPQPGIWRHGLSFNRFQHFLVHLLYSFCGDPWHGQMVVSNFRKSILWIIIECMKKNAHEKKYIIKPTEYLKDSVFVEFICNDVTLHTKNI